MLQYRVVRFKDFKYEIQSRVTAFGIPLTRWSMALGITDGQFDKKAEAFQAVAEHLRPKDQSQIVEVWKIN